MAQRVRILIVDDSAVFADVMGRAIEAYGDAELVGVAEDGRQGVELAHRLKPDVISMDVHMPEMDGLDAVEHIMDETPTPIAMITAADSEEMSRISFRAIGSGALDVISKPSGAKEAASIVRRLCILSKVRAVRRPRKGSPRAPRFENGGSAAATGAGQTWAPGETLRPVDVVAIAISTGGPPVLEKVLQALPKEGYGAGILIVQHLSPGFDTQLVDWLRSSTGADIRLAASTERVEPGVAWVAPADTHLRVRMGGRLDLDPQGDRVSGHRPSGTALLESVARTYGRAAAGLVLTGMGDDGADGLLALRKAGGLTAAQDAQTSAVDGMPRAARERNAADWVVRLGNLPAFVAALGAGSR